MTRRRGLDGLRGLAVILVLMFHFTWGFALVVRAHSPGLLATFYSGQYGVELFFTISGYVILMTVDRTPDLKSFAIARFSRLYPAFFFAVIFTTAVTSATGFNPDSVTPADFFCNFVMITFLLWIPAVDTSYWTLSYEVVFYVIISVTLLGFRIRKPELVCLVWLAIACFCRFVLHTQLPSVNHPGSWLAVATASDYAQFFVLGMMIYRVHLGHREALTFLTLGLALLPIVMTVMHIPAVDAEGSSRMDVRYGGMIAIFAILVYLAPIRRIPFLQVGPLPWLGDISYSLYLIHQFVGYRIISELETRGVNPNFAIIAAAIAVVGAATIISYTIERPGQRLLVRLLLKRSKPSFMAPPP